jgi:hypothetical protein
LNRIDAILKAYVALRRQGSPPRQALETLRPQIEHLAPGIKGRIVAGVRYYEKHHSRNGANQPRITTEIPNRPPVQIPRPMHTRRLNRGGSARSDLFKPDTSLVLRLPRYSQFIELRPQNHDRSLIFGRYDEADGVIPDVDFGDYDGAELGVSRLHMSLAYDERHSRLVIKDMGSANGIQVNGQPLAAYESYVLHTGDYLELGGLLIQIIYAHNK